MDDEYKLINACQSGNVAAFEVLVRKYQDRIIRVLYLLLGNADDAQDVAQETFIRAFRCINAFKGTASFATWLHRIAINSARNWIRDCKREKEILTSADDIWHSVSDKPEDSLLAKERTLEIRSALAQLPTHYREAIILRHFDELSYEEIAEVQQVPIGTVRSRLAKARMLLQTYLGHGHRLSEKKGMADNGLQEGKTTRSIRSRWGAR